MRALSLDDLLQARKRMIETGTDLMEIQCTREQARGLVREAVSAGGVSVRRDKDGIDRVMGVRLVVVDKPTPRPRS